MKTEKIATQKIYQGTRKGVPKRDTWAWSEGKHHSRFGWSWVKVRACCGLHYGVNGKMCVLDVFYITQSQHTYFSNQFHPPQQISDHYHFSIALHSCCLRNNIFYFFYHYNSSTMRSLITLTTTMYIVNHEVFNNVVLYWSLKISTTFNYNWPTTLFPHLPLISQFFFLLLFFLIYWMYYTRQFYLLSLVVITVHP